MKPKSVEHKTCLICNSSSIYKLDEYYPTKPLVRCQNCAFVFMKPIPTQKELELFYSDYDYAEQGYLSELTIKRYHELLDEFEQYKQTKNILDVGCGRGWFLIEAQKRGWKVYGTEYSKKAIELCTAQGIEMKQGVLRASDFKETFDVITSFEVIEHINNPVDEISQVSQLLRKQGLFYCTTPNFNSLNRYYLKSDYNVIHYPEHLSYYTKKTLKNLMKAHGFRPLKVLTTGFSFSRVKSSKGEDEKLISAGSTDEKVRNKMESNLIFRFIKLTLNVLLNLTSSGMSLKGYFIKK